FSGSAVVAYMYKTKGLRVLANDRLAGDHQRNRAMKRGSRSKHKGDGQGPGVGSTCGGVVRIGQPQGSRTGGARRHLASHRQGFSGLHPEALSGLLGCSP
ncbi:MAG: hypothetical protein ACUVRE_07865, partial [Thermoanaerobaculaceae bacterium]